MPNGLTKLRRLLAIQWSTMIQYRTDLILWTLADAATPLIAFIVWYNVSLSARSPYNGQQTITYYLLVVFVTIVTQAWGGHFLAQDILNGDIIKYLVRPLSAFWGYVAENFVEKIIKLLLPIVLAATLLILKPNALVSEVYQLSHLLLFMISLLCAVAINFLIDMVLGVLAFWLEDANEIRRFKFLIDEFTSGALIPLVMMPPLAVSIFNFLPARYVISAPIEVLMGQAEGPAAMSLLGRQLVWVVGLGLLLSVLWRKGLRRYAVPGQ